MEKKQMLNIRLPESEMKILENYCQTATRTKTEVLREFIRSLRDK
jgi:predicted DNA-binding protein